VIVEGATGTAGADGVIGLMGEDDGVITLVDTATEEVEMTVLLAGQLVTPAPQLVTVYS